VHYKKSGPYSKNWPTACSRAARPHAPGKFHAHLGHTVARTMTSVHFDPRPHVILGWTKPGETLSHVNPSPQFQTVVSYPPRRATPSDATEPKAKGGLRPCMPPRWCARPPMGGCAIVEWLLGGALRCAWPTVTWRGGRAATSTMNKARHWARDNSRLLPTRWWQSTPTVLGFMHSLGGSE
jgi:hypothetical protein